MRILSQKIKKAIALFFMFTFFALTITSCKKDEVLPEGVIYLQIIADGSFTSYSDNNDGIPSTFTKGTFYKCNEGSYSYSAKIGSYTWTSKTYSLSKPLDGKRRNYTLSFYTNSNGMAASVNYDDVDQ